MSTISQLARCVSHEQRHGLVLCNTDQDALCLCSAGVHVVLCKCAHPGLKHFHARCQAGLITGLLDSVASQLEHSPFVRGAFDKMLR